jgi:uncharacterized protein
VKDLLKDITSSIVAHPDEVKVEETADETGLVTLQLKVHEEDMGRVIGKEGKIISAIRTLMRVAAVKQGTRLRIDLVEPPSPAETEKTPTE